MMDYPAGRFAAMYACLGAVALTSIALFFVIIFSPVTPVAHKADIKKALGASDEKQLLALAEERIGEAAAGQGVTVTSQKLVRVEHPSRNVVVLVMRVQTANAGAVTLRVKFQRGIYSISDITQA